MSLYTLVEMLLKLGYHALGSCDLTGGVTINHNNNQLYHLIITVIQRQKISTFLNYENLLF